MEKTKRTSAFSNFARSFFLKVKTSKNHPSHLIVFLFAVLILSFAAGAFASSKPADAAHVPSSGSDHGDAHNSGVHVFSDSRGGHGGSPSSTGSLAEVHGAAPGGGGAHGQRDAGGHGGGNAHDLASVPDFITPGTAGVGAQAFIPFFIIAIPLLAAIGICVFRGDSPEHFKIRNIFSLGACLLVLLALIAMWPAVIRGHHVDGKLLRGLYFSFAEYIPNFKFSFRVDPLGLCVAVVSALLWLGSCINAVSYMTHEKRSWRYDFLTIATLASQMGVLMAGDLFTLFIFFEGLIIFPYGMVAHKEDSASKLGANTYLYMGVFTGLFLLAGMILLYGYAGSVDLKPMAETLTATVGPTMRKAIFACMVIGFGGKAGLFLEHAWLPMAHPVAPAPGSTLLSGAMIKCGAYGIIRTACMIFGPENPLNPASWIYSQTFGYTVIWIGVVSMFLAVLSALITANAKKMLAFHSVSQMGYIVMGIGCAAYLGKDGAMGMSGAVYHIVNHAIFKASLFICVGTIYFRTHELDMYKLGGLWRKMPLTCLGLFIAACGIAGIPMFNGFASKTLLHHAILESYQHSAHYTANGLPDVKLRIAEMIFMVTAGGTFASNMKLFALTAFGKRPKKYDAIKPAPLPMQLSVVFFSALIIFIGLNPNWMLENFIGPSLAYFGYDPASHPYHLIYNIHAEGLVRSTIPILVNPLTGGIFSDSAVVHNILGGTTAAMMGGMYFIPGMQFHLFHAVVPEKFTCFYWYERAYRKIRKLISGPEGYGALSARPAIVPREPISDKLNEHLEAMHRLYEKVEASAKDASSKNLTPHLEAMRLLYEKIQATTKEFSTHEMDVARHYMEEIEKLRTSGTARLKNFIVYPILMLEEVFMSVGEKIAVELWLPMSDPGSLYGKVDRFVTSRLGGDVIVDGYLASTYLKLCDWAASSDVWIIDGCVNGIAWCIRLYSQLVRRTQTGKIQNYALLMFMALLIIEVLLHLP